MDCLGPGGLFSQVVNAPLLAACTFFSESVLWGVGEVACAQGVHPLVNWTSLIGFGIAWETHFEVCERVSREV